MHVDPTQEQVQAFTESAAAEGPVFMLNLLRFKDRADGPLESEGISGAEAYARYAAAIQPDLERVGGEVVWAGPCDTALIGPADGEWDVAAVVRYPSRSAFLEMVADPDYLEKSRIRTAALADSRLLPCTEAAIGS